jgi:hypothetical protein
MTYRRVAGLAQFPKVQPLLQDELRVRRMEATAANERVESRIATEGWGSFKATAISAEARMIAAQRRARRVRLMCHGSFLLWKATLSLARANVKQAFHREVLHRTGDNPILPRYLVFMARALTTTTTTTTSAFRGRSVLG